MCTGVVKETTSGKPIAGARVDVIGTETKARTGADGTFRVELPAGTYTVRISADGYSNRTIPRLVIRDGKTARVEIKLSEPVKAEKDSIIVNVLARLRRAAESAQLARRQKASAVSETISAETIKKSTGSDATAAVQRATGVTIREGGGSKTVFVRGLGERYTSALLNANRLPSPDALKRAVPLDLFPADFLEGIDIIKGYTPDLPGDFSGGLVDMRLRDFPDKQTYSIGVSTGANTETTGQDFLTYDSGNGVADYFGMGEAARNWPHSTPDSLVDGLAPPRRFALGRQFHNVWSPETTTAPVDWGANFSLGDSIGPFGYQLGVVYDARWRTIENALKRQLVNQGDDAFTFHTNQSTFATRLGGVLTTAYRIADNHTISARGFFNRASADETRRESGVDVQGNFLDQSRLRYVEDELAFGQLTGEHNFNFISVDWRSAFSRSHATSRTRATRPTSDRARSLGAARVHRPILGGTRISNETRETLSDSGLDLTIPFTTALPGTDLWSGLPGKAKFGAAYSRRKRSFAQRRIKFETDASGVDTTLPPEDIFDPGNFGPGGDDLTETTQPTDHFKGTHDILGSYGMLELPIIRDTLRLVGGARYEQSDIQLDTIVASLDLCGEETTCPQSFIKKNNDVIPGVNLIYNPTKDMNVSSVLERVRVATGATRARTVRVPRTTRRSIDPRQPRARAVQDHQLRPALGMVLLAARARVAGILLQEDRSPDREAHALCHAPSPSTPA